jgi:hypothetical protein
LVRTRSQLWPRDEPSARTRGARGDADRRPLDLAALRSLSAEALVRILDELTPAELRKLCTRQNKEDTYVLGWTTIALRGCYMDRQVAVVILTALALTALTGYVMTAARAAGKRLSVREDQAATAMAMVAMTLGVGLVEDTPRRAALLLAGVVGLGAWVLVGVVRRRAR